MEHKDIMISIIVPVYNAEKYLNKCLNSVINQTLKDIEIIIVDDGSTDTSSNICKEFAQKDNRIVYFKKENEGLAAARQDGLELAKGKYVGFVDSDDWLELDMYERMYKIAKDTNADVVFCNCFSDETDKERIYLKPGIYYRDDIEKHILPRTLAGINEKGNNDVIRWCNWLRLYRMDLIKAHDIKFDRRFRRSQDLQLTFETALVANVYVSINDEYLYHNRTIDNGNSLSRGYTKNYWGLIRPLIDSLENSVERYKKQDLSQQMSLCTFFFAATGVKNEFENSGSSLIKIIKKLRVIIRDEKVYESLKDIDKEELSAYYKMIYEGIASRNAIKLYCFYAMYQFKYNVYRPLIRKMREMIKQK